LASVIEDLFADRATTHVNDYRHEIARAVLDSGLVAPVEERFECPAGMYHGPGSQSRTRCERHDPHDLDGEHYARNPMEPGFEWIGRDGWGNR
jgi:hypothetical protein